MASPPEKRAPPPPPLIGRAGNLTIFITPPPPSANISKLTPTPVQAPPMRWEDERSVKFSSESVYEFLSAALAKAQTVHSILDAYVADWLGLNDSKYQRELNDYYERMEKPLKNEFGNATKPKYIKSNNQALYKTVAVLMLANKLWQGPDITKDH